MRAPGFQAFCAVKTLAASKRQPVYYKIVLQIDQFQRKKTLFFFNKCLDFYGSNIICPRSLLGWIVQVETLEGKLLLSIFKYVDGGDRGVE